MQNRDNITTRLLNEQLLAKQLLNVDLNDLVPFLEEILNHAMCLQRQEHMNALPFERTPAQARLWQRLQAEEMEIDDRDAEFEGAQDLKS